MCVCVCVCASSSSNISYNLCKSFNLILVSYQSEKIQMRYQFLQEVFNHFYAWWRILLGFGIGWRETLLRS